MWRAVREAWPDLYGLTVAEIGHATPYLPPFLGESARVVAFMPASHGVRLWPADGPRLVALAEDAGFCPCPTVRSTVSFSSMASNTVRRCAPCCARYGAFSPMAAACFV